jgi:hypothetical protein
MRILYPICIVLTLLSGGLPPLAFAFDFGDLEKLEKAEQEDLLAKAGQAARNWNFSEANSLLSRARNKGYAPTEVEAVEQLIASNQSAKAEKERREEEERQAKIAAAKAEEERQRVAAREAQARRDASGDMGGSLNCSQIVGNDGLWRYCTSGGCDGFTDDGVWNLCKNNRIDGISNDGVWRYLKTGDSSGFADDSAWRASKKFAGSFADRKRFVIYYLNGHILGQ